MNNRTTLIELGGEEKHVDAYLAQCKSTLKTKKPSGYHTHHIIPRCLGGDNSPDNLVNLHPMKHIEAHMLLALVFPNHLGLQTAAEMLSETVPKCYKIPLTQVATPEVILQCYRSTSHAQIMKEEKQAKRKAKAKKKQDKKENTSWEMWRDSQFSAFMSKRYKKSKGLI